MFRLIKSIFRLQGEGNGGIMLFVISGKQVKILYEPVAVRCEKNSCFCPIAAGRGQAIGIIPEKAGRFSAESKYPCDESLLL